MAKREYLCVTFIGKNGQMKTLEGVDVPRVNDYVEFEDEHGSCLFDGHVSSVKWRFRDIALGNSVRVYLE